MEKTYVARIEDKETGKVFIGICEPYVYMTKYVINVKFMSCGYLYKIFSEGLLFPVDSKQQRCHISRRKSRAPFWDADKVLDGMAMLNDELVKSQKILQLIIFKKGGNIKIDIDMNFDLCSLPEPTMYEKWAEILQIPKIRTGKKL